MVALSNENKKSSALVRFSKGFSAWSSRWVPSSMVFVLILTLVVGILAIVICRVPFFMSSETQMSLVDSWIKGFWSLLTFAMQMALLMITGSVVANSPPVKKAIMKIAGIPNSQISAIIVAGAVCFVMSWVHWGFGMMAAIILGREILAQSRVKGYKIHMVALVGCTYAVNCAVCGISVAAPIYAANTGFLRSMVTEEFAAMVPESLPLSATVLQPVVLIQVLVLAVMAIVVVLAMTPKNSEDIVEISEEFKNEILADSGKPLDKSQMTPADRLNNSPILNIIIGGIGMAWCIKLLATKGIVGISVDNYNFLMLCLGILLNKTPDRFMSAVNSAVGAVSGVIIQFPFYAGIFGIISYTGLNTVIADAFVSISSAKTFPAISYIYSSILNFFVPSGGSKFVIEAPYLVPAAVRLGADLPAVVNAYSFGDLTTNLIQPFWALPIIAMYKVKFKDLLPYGFIVCILALLINLAFMLTVY